MDSINPYPKGFFIGRNDKVEEYLKDVRRVLREKIIIWSE